MNETQALEMLRPLTDGVDPFTGEELAADSLYQRPQVIRALFVAVRALEKESVRIRKRGRQQANAGQPWTSEEDERLITSFDAGKSFSELSRMHQRTVYAMTSRLKKLGKLQEET